MTFRTDRARAATRDRVILGLATGLAALGLAYSLPAVAAGSHDGGHHGAAGSHDGGHHGATVPAMLGKAAPATEAGRTVTVKLVDNAYEPSEVTVSAGETVRFVITNAGELVHEFNLGTPAMHAAHQKEMMEMVNAGVLEADRIDHDKMSGGHGMSHADPNSVLLEPGQSGEIAWTFPQSGTIEIACNVPGHYEAGMTGRIEIQ